MSIPTYRGVDTMPPNKPKSGLWWKILLLFGSGFLVLVVVLTIAASGSVNNELDKSKAAAANASARASSQAEAQARLNAATDAFASAAAQAVEDAAAKDRTAMEAANWNYVDDYLYYADAPEGTPCSGTHTCDIIIVTTTALPDGCPGGIGVRGSFLTDSGLSVYDSARTTGALHTNEQAQLEFTDFSDNGSTFRVDSMSCYS